MLTCNYSIADNGDVYRRSIGSDDEAKRPEDPGEEHHSSNRVTVTHVA